MKPAIPLLLASAFVLAACGGDEVVRERTVVERQPVVTKETVVERPAVVGSTAPACTYESRSFSAGSVSCQEGREFRCTNGAWERTETFC